MTAADVATMPNWVSVKLRVRLLEDLHCGSGLGNGGIDAAQARDRLGRPVIWWSHVKGVFRATAESLLARGASDLDPEALFGWDSRSGVEPLQGSVLVGSAYLDEQASPPAERWFLSWSSTARSAGNRQPLDDTKRTDEYVSAGCVFESACELNAVDLPAFRKIVQATARLGAKRSRGALVRIDLVGIEPARPLQLAANNGKSRCLRLLLRARDPLCFPTLPSAGNIVDSQPFIPGSALLGAVVNAVKPVDPDRTKIVADLLERRSISMGNGYPLPSGWSAIGAHADEAARDSLASLELLPAPLNARRSKSTAGSTTVPDWARSAGAMAKFLESATTDPLLAVSGDAGEGKRLADDAFIFRDTPQSRWQLYRAPVMQRMRIGAPDVGWQLTPSDRRDLANRQDLFTSEEIPEHTDFVTDVLFDSCTDADTFVSAINQRAGSFRLGRGGRPVNIVRAVWLPDSPAPEAAADDHASTADAKALRVVLASDLLLRGPRLGFVTQFDRSALEWMLTDAGQTAAAATLVDLRCDGVADTAQVAGFNASSGLPRAGQIALRRGSVLRISGSQSALSTLRSTLLRERAWGERTHEGYGRICVYAEGVEWSGTPTHTQGLGDRSPLLATSARAVHADENIAQQTLTWIEDPRHPVSRLLAGLPKSGVYDFASLAKITDRGRFFASLRALLEHHRLRAGSVGTSVPALEAFLAILNWREGDPRLQERAQRRLYYAARWAIALGCFKHQDTDETIGASVASGSAEDSADE